MGKSTIFAFSMIRRSDGTELTMKSERIEGIMRALSNGYSEEQFVGKTPKRNIDGILPSQVQRVMVYRPELQEYYVTVPLELQRECSVEADARCACWGLSRPPLFRDHTAVCVNLSWLCITGLGGTDGLQMQLAFPITLTDIKLCSQMIKLAAVKIIEDYARPFTVSVTINEND
jgi:hypothetical protein